MGCCTRRVTEVELNVVSVVKGLLAKNKTT